MHYAVGSKGQNGLDFELRNSNCELTATRDQSEEGRDQKAVSGRALFVEPLLTRDARLPQETLEETDSDLARMRIGNDDSKVSAPHLGMPTPGVRPFESQLSKPSHELAPSDRGQPGHSGELDRLGDSVEVDSRDDGDGESEFQTQGYPVAQGFAQFPLTPY